MSDIPKVSVIVPVYNASRHLECCIGSILNQSLNSLEIICVDDCSTDNSVEILQKLCEKDNRIKVIKQDLNLGAGAARNAGMEIARGEYLSFLDADDYFSSEMFKVAVENADSMNLDIIVFGAIAVNDATGEEAPMHWNIKENLVPDLPVFSAKDVKEDFFQIFIWWAWDKLFRKSFIDKHSLKFQEIRTSNDLAFTASATLIAERIAYINEPLVFQRQKIDTSLSSTRHLSYDCCLKAIIALKEFMVKQHIYERFNRDFKNYALNFLIWNLNSIGQDAYEDLYLEVKNFYSNLTILEDDVYYQPFFEAYLFILEHSAEEYLFFLRMKLGHDIEESHNKIAWLETTNIEAKEIIEKLEANIQHLTSEASNSTLILEELKAAKQILMGDHEQLKNHHSETISRFETQIAEKDVKLDQQSQLISSLIGDINQRDSELNKLFKSRSWKITAPMRWITKKLR